ncbi:MAG: bifunctional GNAT family N-acetyltransferase/carbon-nitrogen hydrolase family protein [Phaeodactylibacter sp.]|nr:bifunctional GNAT family N-acetyltransferase/carbon-nitrogen hydrolase family protein [Phaeodactylibacter sp.]MCB9264896.1 bifunctional GNAT family N-acetyltransferase/carbon-nitrogen hydrolase family protein [Lewinellaceae bacterium]MCB9291073.1 bifunctional GNAT family N-acetyltransferase/carbon-nitrogen hydrolase family protein [Lewinellaceae bacterium]
MPKDIQKIELRNLQLSDYREIKASMIEAYSDIEEPQWKEEEIRILLEKFPEGQFVILADGKVVGSALAIIVSYASLDENHSYDEITGHYTFDTHNPDGDVLYGIDVFVHPEYRGLRLGRRLYDARKELCERLNLRGILFGGRIPNYRKFADELTPREYIQKVRRKEIYDPVLSFQLSNDFHAKKILKGYLPEDESSLEYAVMLEWDNIYYQKQQKLEALTKQVVRLGLVQWQMRPFSGLDALFGQLEFFVDAVSAYQTDFVLFPELFNAPLLAGLDNLYEAEAIRGLAEYTEPIRNKLREFAISYNVNIIGGSMPFIREGRLVNIGFLCRRDGTTESYEKLHVTPNEASHWGMEGGNKLTAFDTDCGKVGVLIGYDAEFPELSRLLAEEEVQILFVPFHTNTQNEFIRIQLCGRARAIENECYVAIAGSVGNLPKVSNMDIQVAQSAVFTPADFAFPGNGVLAEAPPNTETTLIAELDLDLLKHLHSYGSLRNLQGRRTDLFELRKK